MSNLTDREDEEGVEEKKKVKLLIEIGDEWIDAKYLMRMRKIEKYDEDNEQLRFGFMINENVPDFYSMKDYEILFDTEEERDETLKRIRAKLEVIGIEII